MNLATRSVLVVMAIPVTLLGCGCSPRQQRAAALPDSTGTVLGQLHGEFVHGFNPFYGSVVYLIPVTPQIEEW